MERYKQVCHEIREQINPSDEFIQDLKMNLNNRVAKEKMKRKVYLSKVAMIFCILTFVSTGVFAMNIGDWFSQIFSNGDEGMQVAVENGYVQNVDMDYVEHAEIAIKVNSLVIDDNKINIVFDVQGEIDGEITLKELYLSTDGDEYLNKNLKVLSTLYSREFKSVSKYSHLLIIKMTNVEKKLNVGENLNIILNGLFIFGKNDKFKEINETWNCNVLLEEDNFKNHKTVASKYIMHENKYIENYEINVTNTGTNIQIDFKNNFDKYSLMNKNNIYAETENGEKYLCRELSRIKNDMIEINLPITIYDNIQNFNLILKLENEKLKFNVEKQK